MANKKYEFTEEQIKKMLKDIQSSPAEIQDLPSPKPAKAPVTILSGEINNLPDMTKINISNAKYAPNDTAEIKDLKMYGWKGHLTWLEKIKLKFKSQSALMINMELVSGDHTHFIAYINESFYKYKDKTYIIDESLKYYDIRFKMWCLDYHENLSFPIKRIIPIEDIKRKINVTGVTDVEMAFNPTSLRLFIESQVIQKVIKGADMDKMLDFIKKMLILVLIVTVVTLLLLMKSSGMFNNIHLPWVK